MFKKRFAPIIGGTIGMRNITIHQYEDMDYSILWDFIKDELPRSSMPANPLLVRP